MKKFKYFFSAQHVLSNRVKGLSMICVGLTNGVHNYIVSSGISSLKISSLNDEGYEKSFNESRHEKESVPKSMERHCGQPSKDFDNW